MRYAEPRSSPARRTPLDVATLHALAEDLGSEFVAETAMLFLAELGDRLDAIRRAADAWSADDLAAAAHILKSASALLGASDLAAACAAVELAARQATVSADDVAAVHAEAPRARMAILGYLRRRPASQTMEA